MLASQTCGDLEGHSARNLEGRGDMAHVQHQGDNAGHAFYARRRVLDRVVPHPFVMAAWALEQLSLSQSLLRGSRSEGADALLHNA